MKIWMIGARGTIATTTSVGILAAQRGLLPLEGVLTETAPFQPLGLTPLAELAVGGCDLQAGDLRQAVEDNPSTPTVFHPRLLAEVAGELESIPVSRGILRGAGPAVAALAGPDSADWLREPARAAVGRVLDDLRTFAGSGPAVVVNLASTEPLPDPALAAWGPDELDRALDADDPRIPASSLYAYAALEAGLPYVNFTPSTGASLPALQRRAREAGIPLAGRDGKTGETLVKTALAPMFAIRALTVEGWYGANILGNTDGRVLSHAENRASKVASKAGVLERCLGYPPEGAVRIDYFPPLQDDKVAWDFIQFRGWGGRRMRMQFTWEGTDAVLAAPLVLDLARLAELARRRGQGGPVGALGLFFKSPEGSDEMNLHRQYDALLAWARGG